MLYANPRGISCIKCHGDKAKGKKIATFTHFKNKIKYNCTIQSQDITNISYNDFLRKLDPKLKKKSIQFNKDEVCKKLIYGNSMPTYFLTNEELESIYFYLKNQKKYQ